MGTLTNLLLIVNQVRAGTGRDPLSQLTPELTLRGELGLDSLDMAELAVRIEDRFGVDVFAVSIPQTVGDIVSRLGD